ncbi:nuclear transport factor 2 family protein [Oceanibaculum pacificum]|uniref:Ketosteroid isomerase n=1 Tax=Oceanibaculum pacificum TaxID=580166 RepID=A0A154VI73_9PROT|nr:nuclear transport factor 2 family protein [Oceanibaculum pacificum]KZD01042.1 ketosteroid isomerase [Oceanibaculum pacificum]
MLIQNIGRFHLALVCAVFLAAAPLLPAKASQSATQEATNTALVQQAFDNWRQGRGSVFDLLSDDAVWVVAGISPYSGTYETREDFLERAVRPIVGRLATPITPDVKQIVAQGEHVVVMWDGTATAKNGDSYRNSYAWHLVLAEGKITRVTAFLDTWSLNELMR